MILIFLLFNLLLGQIPDDFLQKNDAIYLQEQKSLSELTQEVLISNQYTLLSYKCGEFAKQRYVRGCSMSQCVGNVTSKTIRSFWEDPNISINEIKIGDIVTFRNNNNKKLVTHRVYDIREWSAHRTLILKGDNNSYLDPYVIGEYELIGRTCVKE